MSHHDSSRYREKGPGRRKRRAHTSPQAEAHMLRLSPVDQELFAQAILAPPPVALAVMRAFARHSKLVD